MKEKLQGISMQQSTIFDGADYIYFFTDTISHGTYGKYMKATRSRGISSYDYS